MGSTSTQRSVGELVIERPSRSRVLSRLGIDFCCGGKRSLEAACLEKNLDAGEVLELLMAEPTSREDASAWASAPLGAVVNHIVSTHHAFTKEELPRLTALLEKVARVHGARLPHMVEAHALFAHFATALLVHMGKEERVLFPAIQELDGGGRVDVSAPIARMEAEHDEAGDVLRRLRELTSGYEPAADACNTTRAALSGLAELEADLHEHVHLENNVLFPRALRRRA